MDEQRDEQQDTEQIAETTPTNPTVTDFTQATPMPPTNPPEQVSPQYPPTQPIVNSTVTDFTQAKPSIFKNKRKLIIIIVAIIGLLVISLSSVFFLGKLGGTPKYKQTKTASIGYENEKITYTYPTEMTEKSKLTTIAEYVHYQEKDKSKKEYSTVEVNTSYFGEIDSTIINKFREMFLDKGDGYQEFVDAAKRDSFSESKDFSIGNFSEFKNNNISNGFIADYEYNTDDYDKNGEVKGKVKIKGKVLVALGKKDMYIYAFSAVEPVWNKNQKFINNIFDNIKIDQQ